MYRFKSPRQRNMVYLQICLLISLMHCSYSQNFIENLKSSPCSNEIFSINLPCTCSTDDANGTVINCDGLTFLGDFPVLPHRQKIHSFSQSGSGLQSLEAQLFTASDIPLQRVDFSNNLLRRLTERTFEGVEDTLTTINLQNNKLGDQLNSIFATEEFQRLASLEILDLSGNGIKDFKAGIFNGLMNLKTLHLERNQLSMVPRSALQGLKSLRYLHLQANNILDIGALSFPNLTNLQSVNLSANDISAVHNGAFSHLKNLKTLILSNNQIQVLDSNFLEGLNLLEHLDLSQNLLETIPMNLESKPSLKTLILYSNKIRSLNHIPLDKFQFLEYLDLRRNRIFEIPANRFANLRNLKELHLDVNAIRKVTNEMFLGLENLSDLTLNDNRILAFPSEPLNMFKNLKKLNLDYNRIAAVSREILAPVKFNKELSLAYNLISEIPDGTFTDFKNLELLNLHGNKISNISKRKIEGLDQSLLYLDVGYNELSELPLLNFSNLLILSVAKNKISRIKTENLAFLSKILHLNLSYNLLSELQSDYFTNLNNMQSLDLQHNLLTTIPRGAFENLSVNEISLKHNKLKAINEETFKDLTLLKLLDLSNNVIEVISKNAFSNTPNIEILNLMENSITAFRGDEFSSDTNIQSLILSHNKLNYLYPKTFEALPNVKYLDLSFNELTIFPRETVNNLGFLTKINLAGNKLHSIGDGYFAHMPFLKRVELQNNVITSVSELAFLNSSSLRTIFLQNNNITSIHEYAFVDLNRLELDVSNNKISKLPNNIFSRSKGLKLEAINIAFNDLKEFPNEALKRQYSFLEKVNISYNKINNLPSNADVLVNIKELDISYNPLLPDAHYALFGEPKSVRKLYVQGTGLANLPTIECPFLRELHIKENQLSRISTSAFDRTNMLSYLDVSYNMITDVSSNFNGWLKLSNLKQLDLSGNPIQRISKTDFNHLLHLRKLKICNLKELADINCDSLHSLPRLRELYLYGLSRLQNFDVKSCLQNISSLNILEVEVKDSLLKNQLQSVFSPKLDTLSVSGQRLRSVSSSAFAGMLSPTIRIQLTETSIDTFSDKIFLPLPLSSKIEFKIPSNRIQRLTLEMLSVLDNKQVDLVVYGLSTNPIKCDCNIHFLWHWLQDKSNATSNYHTGYKMMNELQCYEPVALRNRKVKELKLSELVCQDSTSVKSTEITFETSSISTSTQRETTSTREHPLIIFEQPITKRPVVPLSYVPSSDTRSTLTKVDTMIIGIVAGVVAFVCILIIIICIIRLRRAHPLYTAGPLAGPLAFRAQGKCTCLKPPPNNCTCYPIYTMPYAGRPPLPNNQHKMLPPSLPPPPGFLATGHSGRLRNTPYYVTYPDSDNENK